MEGVIGRSSAKMVDVKIPGTGHRERLYYWCEPHSAGRKIFVHEHIPAEPNGCGVVFLNPLLDEKKRVQRFQAQTARYCADKGIMSLRFDYFGTGDSEGASYELDLEHSLEEALLLIDRWTREYHLETLLLFGTRLGADIAVQLAKREPARFRTLHLLEPVVNGRRYLMEQRLRRQAFAKLKMLIMEDQVNINGKPYEDFQGFLWSGKLVRFIEELRSDQAQLKNHKIHIYKINYFASRKPINELVDRLSEHNKVSLHPCDGKDFWSSMDPIDTKTLSMFLAEAFNS